MMMLSSELGPKNAVELAVDRWAVCNEEAHRWAAVSKGLLVGPEAKSIGGSRERRGAANLAERTSARWAARAARALREAVLLLDEESGDQG